jgi:SAM-dependent methyltransferase
MKEYDIRPKKLFNKYLELSETDAKSFDSSVFENTSCVACNSTSTMPKFDKHKFSYHICGDCGSLFCNPRPTSVMLTAFYRDSISAKFWAEVFIPTVEDARRETIFKKKAKDLSELLEKKGIVVQSICDVGAGSGIFIEELSKLMPEKRYHAIEPGISASSSLAAKGIEVLNESVENSDNWARKFDFVVSLEVFEHVYDPTTFIKSIYNLLAPKGACLITTLGYDGFDIQILGSKSNSVSPPHHLNFFSVMGFEILFRNAGFSEVEITTPGQLDIDIVGNSDTCPDFVRKIYSRGSIAIQDFQKMLVKHKLSSHVWIYAKK